MHPYQQVINSVKPVNRQAALFLARRLPLLVMRDPKGISTTQLKKYPTLISAFRWARTPQGVDYWADINERIKP